MLVELQRVPSNVRAILIDIRIIASAKEGFPRALIEHLLMQ